MARVVFTKALARHGDASSIEVDAATVREALDAVFAGRPQLRSYVLDEQGALRFHVTLYVNGEPLVERTLLGQPLGPDAELYVMQALSGG